MRCNIVCLLARCRLAAACILHHTALLSSQIHFKFGPLPFDAVFAFPPAGTLPPGCSLLSAAHVPVMTCALCCSVLFACTHFCRDAGPWLQPAVISITPCHHTFASLLHSVFARIHAGTLPPGCSLLSAAQGLVAEGGAAALFRGNLVNVMRSAPARAVDFFAFDL
jgi:hypothetical protein